MTSFLVAPTEPPEIQVLGTRSPVPESLGVDVLWAGANGLCGVQRKTVSDLIASVQNDDRLGREFEQMRRLAWKGLVVEGTPQWTRDGELLDGHKKWSAKQHRGVLMSAQMKGVVVVQSRNHLDTLDAIHQMADWSQRQDHASSLLYRGNGRSEWGELTDEATAVHLMSAFPGIGVELARRIYAAFGRVPIQWSVTAEELMAVKGIGKGRLEKLLKLMSVTNVTAATELTEGKAKPKVKGAHTKGLPSPQAPRGTPNTGGPSGKGGAKGSPGCTCCRSHVVSENFCNVCASCPVHRRG